LHQLTSHLTDSLLARPLLCSAPIRAVSVSVLRRWTLGASQALRALAVEEQQRQAKSAIIFPGHGYRVGDGKKVKQRAQSPAAQADRDAPPQSYPGVDCTQNVVVPFLLLGSFSLKTGAVRLEKAHIRYVYNNISYRGYMRAIGLNASGQYVELPREALALQLEAASFGLQPAPHLRVHKLRFDLLAPWSQATVLISADVDILPPPLAEHQQSQQQPNSPAMHGAAHSANATHCPCQLQEQPQQAPPGGPAHTAAPSPSAESKRARSSSEPLPLGCPPQQSQLGPGFDLLCAAAAQAQMDESS